MGLAKRCTNGYWTVNGVGLYVPDRVTITHDNIVSPDTGRMENGEMYIEWVRRDIVTVDIEIDALTGNEKSLMHSLLQGREFTFTYYDNGLYTINAYCGKDSYTYVNLSAYAREGGLYEGYKASIVQC